MIKLEEKEWKNIELGKEYKITLKNTIKHLRTVNKHRWIVFKLCCKAGEPWRGLTHDLSKYSPTEFWGSVKYYQGGKRSPIPIQKEFEGYSKVWLHHKGRNKHHYEYWYDEYAPEKTPVIPYKYAVEMVCDKLSASIVYEGKNWTNESEINYFRKKEYNHLQINIKIRDFLEEVFIQISNQGIDKTINKKNLKELYNKYCN